MVRNFPPTERASIFYLRRKSSAIVVHQIESGQEKEIYRAVSPVRITDGALSRNGRQLALLTQSAGDAMAVQLVPAGGGALRELFAPPRYFD